MYSSVRKCPICKRKKEKAIIEQVVLNTPCDMHECFFSKEIENALKKKNSIKIVKKKKSPIRIIKKEKKAIRIFKKLKKTLIIIKKQWGEFFQRK